MTKLVINNLACRYDDHVVIDDLSLTLENNDIIALLGPSGCGKTTLLRTIAGLHAVHEGEIHLGDKLVSSAKMMLESEKRNIGMIFQDYALFPHLTVTQNIAFGLTKLTKGESEQRVEAMLKLVKLSDFAQRFPHEISGGQQQRVAIARALAYQPDIMLLDEPFSNIDSQSRGEIMMEIRQILKAQNVPAVFVTHSKDEAFAFADKLAIFNRGKIEQIGTAQMLYQQPSSAYVANFMGKANYIDIISVNEGCVSTQFGDIDVDMTNKRTNTVVMLRPEHFNITPDESGNLLIKSSVFCGSHWIHALEGNGVEINSGISIEVQSEHHYPVDARVAVNVIAHDVVTF